MKRKFLLCKRCGNLIEMINDSEVTPVCCNEPMQELIANSKEAATEKHIPTIDREGNVIKVTVGEVLHPMEESHYIEWIYLETNKGIKRTKLNPGEEPISYFALLEDEEILNAYAYCNLHGLWVNNLK